MGEVVLNIPLMRFCLSIEGQSLMVFWRTNSGSFYRLLRGVDLEPVVSIHVTAAVKVSITARETKMRIRAQGRKETSSALIQNRGQSRSVWNHEFHLAFIPHRVRSWDGKKGLNSLILDDDPYNSPIYLHGFEMQDLGSISNQYDYDHS